MLRIGRSRGLSGAAEFRVARIPRRTLALLAVLVLVDGGGFAALEVEGHPAGVAAKRSNGLAVKTLSTLAGGATEMSGRGGHGKRIGLPCKASSF